MPHETVMKDIHLDGVNFLITRLDGSSLAIYVTNLPGLERFRVDSRYNLQD